MPIFELTADKLQRIQETSFSAAKVRERDDLQRLLRDQIEIISPGTLIIAEEFREWEDSRCRIDLLGIDKYANLVVFELKRTEDGGHMELQALRYAAMVSTMTLDRAIEVYSGYLSNRGKSDDAKQSLLDFLEWDDSNQEPFAKDVRVVLISAKFSKELTTTVLWLNNYGLDIRCVRMKPYNDNGRTIVDIEQVIPLPEAREYQVSVSVKNSQERLFRAQNRDMTKYDVIVFEKSEKRMAKRNAIFFVVKELCNSGISPEKINDLIDPGRRRFLQADGVLDSEEFIRDIVEHYKNNGKSIDYGRWYCEESELIHFDGKTYAFHKMWGGDGWDFAMNVLKDNFPKAKIRFTACDDFINK